MFLGNSGQALDPILVGKCDAITGFVCSDPEATTPTEYREALYELKSYYLS